MTVAHLTQHNLENDFILKALAGKKDAFRWLQTNRRGLFLFVKALTGGKKARESLTQADSTDCEALFAVISNDRLARLLRDSHPEVHTLFEAVKGDEEAFNQLKRKKPSFAKTVQVLRDLHEAQLHDSNGVEPVELMVESAAADVGCLIGEMHLTKGEFHKAIEAFTRAITNQPTADAYEGRAKAYHALALQDERQARELAGN